MARTPNTTLRDELRKNADQPWVNADFLAPLNEVALFAHFEEAYKGTHRKLIAELIPGVSHKRLTNFLGVDNRAFKEGNPLAGFRRRQSRKGFFFELTPREIETARIESVCGRLCDDGWRRFMISVCKTVPTNLSIHVRNIKQNIVRGLKTLRWDENKESVLTQVEHHALLDISNRDSDYGLRIQIRQLLLPECAYTAESDFVAFGESLPLLYTPTARIHPTNINTKPDRPFVLPADHPNNTSKSALALIKWADSSKEPILHSTVSHGLNSFVAGPEAVGIVKAMLKILENNKEALPGDSVRVRLAYYALATMCGCMEESLRQRDHSKLSDLKNEVKGSQFTFVYPALDLIADQSNLSEIVKGFHQLSRKVRHY